MTGPRGAGAEPHEGALIRVAKDHPALPGHFPGEPVVPGVLVLGLVIEAAERQLRRPIRVAGLAQAKFPAPLMPEEDARASFQVDGARLTFAVEREGRLIARGVFRLAPSETEPPRGEGSP